MLGLIVAGVLSLGLFAGEAGPADCSIAPPAPSVELVYRLQGEGKFGEGVQAETVGILCERLQAFELAGQVIAFGKSEILVVLPPLPPGVFKRVADWLGARGHLGIYDWEFNLIGPERRIGGNPGLRPPQRALRRAAREWRAAGRNPASFLNRQLLDSGAFPSLYAAVRLASEQRPRELCPACSATGSQFYLFDRSPRHRPIAGPVASRAALAAAAGGPPRPPGIVLRVPLGVAILSEYPVSKFGRLRRDAAPGWYAVRDRPALTGADIVDPVVGVDQYTNGPSVTFRFTPRGRRAFRQVTRAIAYRGRAQADGPVTNEEAEALSHHLGIVVDGEVASRPIINFAENPDGIDGRVGAQISGGFASFKEAQDVATTMRIGALPADLELVRLTRRGP